MARNASQPVAEPGASIVVEETAEARKARRAAEKQARKDAWLAQAAERKAERAARVLLTPEQAQADLRNARPAQSPCLCGCGGLTKTRFVPGHDAKLKVALTVTAASEMPGAKDAQKALAIFGW